MPSDHQPTRLSMQPVQLVAEDAGLAERLLQACLYLLKRATLCGDSLSSSQQRTLVRMRQLLFLWGENHDVQAGSLDAKLQRSKHLMTVVISALRVLLKNLFEGLIRPKHCKPYHQAILQLLEQSSFIDADDSDAESDDEQEGGSSVEVSLNSAHRTVHEILRELQKGIQCLTDLNASLDAPVLDYEVEHAETAVEVASDHKMMPYQFFANCIRERFPETSAQLIDFLGKANLGRYQRLQQLRYQNEDAIAINVSDAPSKPSGSEFQDSGYGSALRASSYHPSAPSQPPASSYAPSLMPTVVSSRLSSLAEGGRSKYPRLPEEAKSGTLFECAACGRYILASRKHEYRKHLIRDLSPYVCIFDACTHHVADFDNRQAWMGHLQLEHADADLWKTNKCPLCNKAYTDGIHALLADLAKHLEEISLLALPPNVDEDLSESDDSEDEGNIPIPQRSTVSAEPKVSPDGVISSLASLMGTDKWSTQVPEKRTVASKIMIGSLAGLEESPKPGTSTVEQMSKPSDVRKRPLIARTTREKLLCPHCNDQPEGFRGEHELQRHLSRAHARTRKVWICIDKSGQNPAFLSQCKACRERKKYGAYYNAAAHLRRTHFNPRKRGRKAKSDAEKRGGKGCGNWPPMEELKKNWMTEIEEVVEEQGRDKCREPETSPQIPRDYEVVSPGSTCSQNHELQQLDALLDLLPTSNKLERQSGAPEIDVSWDGVFDIPPEFGYATGIDNLGEFSNVDSTPLSDPLGLMPPSLQTPETRSWLPSTHGATSFAYPPNEESTSFPGDIDSGPLGLTSLAVPETLWTQRSTHFPGYIDAEDPLSTSAFQLENPLHQSDFQPSARWQLPNNEISLELTASQESKLDDRNTNIEAPEGASSVFQDSLDSDRPTEGEEHLPQPPLQQPWSEILPRAWGGGRKR